MRGLGFFVGSILAIGDNRSSDDAQLIVHDQGTAEQDASIGKPVEKINNINETSVRISCELNEICLEVENAFLEQHQIRYREKLHLGDSECRGTEMSESGSANGYWRWCTRRSSDGNVVAPDFDCGTKSEVNETHLVYRNALTRNIVAGDIIIGSDTMRTLSMPFGCAWPLNVFVSTSHESDFELHDTIVVESDVAGVGNYEAKMYLYQDETFSSPIQDMPVLDISDNVFIGVELMQAEFGVNVIIERAWATPLPSPYASALQIPIVDHGCPSFATVEELDVHLYANGESSLSTFSTTVFKFAEYEKAYLHAEVKICFADKNTCPEQEFSCNNRNNSNDGRFVRSTEEANVISIGPIYFSRNKDQLLNENINDFVEEILINQPNYVNGGSRLGKTDVLIAALLAVVILLSMIVVSLYLRWRRATRSSSKRNASLHQVVTVTR